MANARIEHEDGYNYKGTFNTLDDFEVDPNVFLYAQRGKSIDIEGDREYSVIYARKGLFSWKEEEECLKPASSFYNGTFPEGVKIETKIGPKNLTGRSTDRKMNVHIIVDEHSSKEFYEKTRRRFEAHLDIVRDMIQRLIKTSGADKQNVFPTITVYKSFIHCRDYYGITKLGYTDVAFSEYGMKSLSSGLELVGFSDVMFDSIDAADFGDDLAFKSKTIMMHHSGGEMSYTSLNATLCSVKRLKSW